MKKSNNNNWKQILKTATFVALVMLVTLVKLSATENAETLKAKEEVSKEEVVIIEDLLNALEEIDEMEGIGIEAVPSVEFYNCNDELIFSGIQESWNAQNTADIIAVKRKAELLFELDRTSIYKVF